MKTWRIAPASSSLAKLSMLGASWTTAGYVASQVLRLGSNLVLTRLLAPEYFGLMALANTLLLGLSMFSDFGLAPNIIQSRRGDDARLLDTAWTIQFMRGCVIWLFCIAGAWPFSVFYDDCQLLTLIPVIGLSALISGLNSTKVYTAQRNIDYGRLTLLELGSQCVSIVVMLIWAFFYPSVWALVGGWLAGNIAKLWATHFLMPGRRNQFCWDRSAVGELFGFGKWIFISTIIHFAATSSGSLILGKIITMAELGVFSIAVTLAKAAEMAFENISGKILLPVFSRLKDMDIEGVRIRLRKVRLMVMAVFLPPLLFFAVFGQWVIEKLFDHRYHDGGWILQVFSVGVMPLIISATGQFYLSKGDSFLMMIMSFMRLVVYGLSMYLGWVLYGAKGMMIGMALFTIPMYILDMPFQRRYGIFMPMVDLAGVSIVCVLLFVGWTFAQTNPFVLNL